MLDEIKKELYERFQISKVLNLKIDKETVFFEVETKENMFCCTLLKIIFVNFERKIIHGYTSLSSFDCYNKDRLKKLGIS